METSARELDAVLISRMLGNRDRVMIGAGLPAPRAGALLAALTFAPGLRVCQALGWLSLEDRRPPAIPRAGMDIRDSAGSEALMNDHEAYDDVRRLSTFFVIGGLEIDAGGASNLLGVHHDGRWIRRGPGAIGTTSMAVLADRTVLYSTRHDPRTFVEKCSLVSAPGWWESQGDRGPRFCVTPAGLFDFPAPERRMRLIATRPGWDLKRIRESTGFEFETVPGLGPVDPPTEYELKTLREVVDPSGGLR